MDLETTGLDTVSDEVVELGIARFSYLQGGTLAGVLDTFSSLNEPSRPILEETIKLLGNTNEMAAGLKIDGDAIDAVRLVANGRLLFCLQRHRLFPSANRRDAFCFKRRFLTAPNRPPPVGEIGDLLIGELAFEGRHRLRALKPWEFLSRNTVKHGTHEIASIAQPKRGVC